MNKERINEYAVRISQSSRGQLVAITCEIAAEYMQDARSSLKEGDKKMFSFYEISHIRKSVKSLYVCKESTYTCKRSIYG